MKWITVENGGRSMSFIEKSFADTGGFGTEGETMIHPEEVQSAVSELPEVKEDLENTAKKLEEVSEPLEAAWIGTARESYMKASFYVQQQIKRIKSGVGGLHGVTIQTCFERIDLDLRASDAANTSQN